MLLSLWVSFLPLVFAQTWCGKVYEQGTPVVPPVGQFPLPVATSPQLVLRCNPAQIPFLPDDLNTPSSVILVDALVWSQAITGAQPLNTMSQDGELQVTVSLDGETLTTGIVGLNGSASLPFPLSNISPRTMPYTLTCTAVTLSSPKQTFTSLPTNLTYLPPPPKHIGSVTKRDLRTGGLLAKRAHIQEPYQPIFPVGFFTNFEGYLENNDTSLEVLKSQGFNVVHPLPAFDNLTAFNHMVDKMEELGLWLMYEMPGGYKNLTSVTEHVKQLRNRTNLLLYYTADEPDGSEEQPPSGPGFTTAYINSLDPYRPSSMVLNCQDYFFSEYAAGTPVLMQDAYPIGINATYSVVWNTSCTRDQGDCGCDNCIGDFEDIRNRVDDFTTRLEVLGWERSTTVWTVPQAFGGPGSRYWSRIPTGAEFLVEMIVAINAGARGSVAWNDPTTPDIKANASALALALPDLTPFLLSSPLSWPPVHYTHVVTPHRLDFGVWASADGKTLVMGSNLNYFAANVTLSEIFSAANHTDPASGSPHMVLDGGGRITGSQIIFGSVQSGAWIFG